MNYFFYNFSFGSYNHPKKNCVKDVLIISGTQDKAQLFKEIIKRDLLELYTDKKENQIFLINKEIQNGAVAKSYMTNGLLIYEEIFAHFSYTY
jgi:hypothetical protein